MAAVLLYKDNFQLLFSMKQIVYTKLCILTATYGPAEGRRLIDGKLVDYSNKETFVPYTRDVLPFLRALMCLSCDYDDDDDAFDDDKKDNERMVQEVTCREGITSHNLDDGDGHNIDDGDQKPAAISCNMKIQTSQMQRSIQNAFPLMDSPMNTVFGDCCPGTTKVLKVEYSFRDYYFYDSSNDDDTGVKTGVKTGDTNTGGRTNHCISSQVFTSTFREHEIPVILKRQEPLHLMNDDNYDLAKNNPQMEEIGGKAKPENGSKTDVKMPSSPSRRLVHNQQHLLLPVILPFLEVRQRARCQLVCRSWRDQVKEQGITAVIDVNDAALFPKHMMNFTAASSPSIISLLRTRQTSLSDTSSPPTSSSIHSHQSRSILRGLLKHSYASLESLVLNDHIPLQPAIDLHPSLPHLRKLKRLDISRIPSITDDTLNLISTHIGKRLEVLYVKGLRQISNQGIVHLVKSCFNLRVLDVSDVHQLSDDAGIAIGNNLAKLEVLHGKDNYKLTNQSVDIVTRNCKQLVQITLWGNIGLKHVDFSVDTATHDDILQNSDNMPRRPPLLNIPPTKLILLNLWGCHGLDDTAAKRLTALPHLRSLCVSECHRLTDQFIVEITQNLPQLLHLKLRYLKRITDTSLEAITQLMHLYSLDLSFCTRLTIEGICHLLKERCNSLSELRLYACRQLQLEAFVNNSTNGGRQLVRALKSVRDESTLSFLDVRACQRQEDQPHEQYRTDNLFLKGMLDLGFEKKLFGLFTRPAKWNERVRRRLVGNLS